MKNSKISLRESAIVLVVALAIMGTGVIGLHLSPQVPVLLAITVVIFFGLRSPDSTGMLLMPALKTASTRELFPSLFLF